MMMTSCAVRAVAFGNRDGNQIHWEVEAKQASETAIDEGSGVLHWRKHKKPGKAHLRCSLQVHVASFTLS